MKTLGGWPRDKARANHDVLGNQVAPAVSYVIRVLEGRVEDKGVVACFAKGEGVRWASIERDLASIIGRFEGEMSPACLFESAPLSLVSDEDRSWMRAVVHESWWEGAGMRSRRDACVLALEGCSGRWNLLVEQLARLLSLDEGDETDEVRSREIAGALVACRAFHEACHELSRSLSRLPSTVTVVIPEP